MEKTIDGKEYSIIYQSVPEAQYLRTNSVGEYLSRAHGRIWRGEVPIIRGAGSHAINVFQITGTVVVSNQIAIITEITNLADCTKVYSTFYDGGSSTDLTSDGIDLSGVAVGTTFFKDKEPEQPYTLLDATTCQIYEPTGKKEGQPFFLIQKYGADCYIRFHLTTATSVNFKMYLEFTYKLINGATLTLA
jgi:hypothetical protein